MESQQATSLISLVAGALLTVVWVIKRRRVRRARGDATGQGADAKAGQFTSGQVVGIVSIILLLVPIFLAVSLNLARGGLILLAFLFRALHLPQPIETALLTLCSVAATFTALSFSYLLCEAVWPEKEAPRSHLDPGENETAYVLENRSLMDQIARSTETQEAGSD